MKVRLAFLGFNPACARLARGVSLSDEAEVVGILSREAPADWPVSLEPPPLFSSRKELFGSGSPDILLVAEDAGELKDVPAKCQVIDVQEGSPAARMLEALPLKTASDISVDREMREIASISSGVSVIEAYSDPIPKLAQLLDRAMAISGAGLGMILLPGDVMDRLSVVLARGEGLESVLGRDLTVTGSLCGRAFDSGTAVAGELEGDMEEARYLEDQGLRSFLALPLRAEGRIIGVMAMGGGGFDAMKMPMLTLVADQAALAVQVARLYSELETNVAMDVASGLFNQRYFHQHVNEEVSRARRYSLNVCLVVMEIDGFDAYIERNGRFMGDFILSDVGKIVRRNTREVDVASRYGDKTFAVLLPETRRLGAVRFAERMRKVMEEYPFPSRERKEVEKLTICAGISSFPANADSDNDLLEKAFKALTSAKTEGPNTVRLFSANLGEEN